MNKLFKFMSLLIVCASLCSCGKKESTISVIDGVISNNGVVVDVDEHCMLSATKTFDDGDVIEYNVCSGASSCNHITFALDESTLPTYNGNKYATFYFDTEVMMWKKSGSSFNEAKYQCKQTEPLSVDTMLSIVDNGLSSIQLGTFEFAIFNNIVKLNCVGSTVKVRKDEIIIPASLRIAYDTGKIDVTDTVNINGVDVGHTSINGYEYYFYNGVCVQVKAGIDVQSLITFL